MHAFCTFQYGQQHFHGFIFGHVMLYSVLANFIVDYQLATPLTKVTVWLMLLGQWLSSQDYSSGYAVKFYGFCACPTTLYDNQTREKIIPSLSQLQFSLNTCYMLYFNCVIRGLVFWHGLDFFYLWLKLHQPWRGWVADWTSEEAVQRDPLWWGREGPCRHVQHSALGPQRRQADGWARQNGGLQEHHGHHDIEPWRLAPPRRDGGQELHKGCSWSGHVGGCKWS